MNTKLSLLMDYGFSRAVGHTSALMNGFKNSPGTILIVAHEDQARQLGLRPHQYFTVGSLPDSIMGLKRPLLIDHYALDILVRDDRKEIFNYYEGIIKNSNNHIEKLTIKLNQEVERGKGNPKRRKTNRKRSLG